MMRWIQLRAFERSYDRNR